MQPNGSVIEEILDRRTLSSKVWLKEVLPDGRKKTQLKSMLGAVHYPENDKWNDVDLIVKNTATGFKVDKAWYSYVTKSTGVGYDYQSKVVGSAELTLTHIDGVLLQNVSRLNITPTEFGNTTIYDELVPGLDLIFINRALGVKTMIIIKDSSAPRKFKFNVKRHNNLRLTIGERGLDNINLLSTGRTSIQKKIEIKVTREAEKSIQGGVELNFEEEFTGNYYENHRIKRFPTKTNGAVFPVFLNQDVNENIVAGSDDGSEYPIPGAFYYTSNTMAFGLTDEPCWRFVALPIPVGSTVDSATNQIEVNNGDLFNGTIFCDVGSAANDAFSDTHLGSDFTNSTANVDVIDTTPAEPTGTRFSSDVQAILQERVNMGAWSNNSNIAFFMDRNSGNQNFRTYDLAQADAPTLVASITEPVGGVTRRKVLF